MRVLLALILLAGMAGCFHAAPPSVPLGTVHGLVASPHAPTFLLAVAEGGLFRSADGAEWTRVGPTRAGLAVVVPHPALPGVLWVGGSEGVLISDDGGARLQTAGLAGIPVRALAASPARVERLWAATPAGQIYRSEDTGETWSLLGQLPAVRAFLPNAVDAETVLAAAESGLLRSRDGGATWEKAANLTFLGLAGDPGDHRALLGADGSVVWKSADGGETWFALPAPGLDGSLAHVALDPSNPQRVWAATAEGSVAASADGGGSWSRVRG